MDASGKFIHYEKQINREANTFNMAKCVTDNNKALHLPFQNTDLLLQVTSSSVQNEADISQNGKQTVSNEFIGNNPENTETSFCDVETADIIDATNCSRNAVLSTPSQAQTLYKASLSEFLNNNSTFNEEQSVQERSKYQSDDLVNCDNGVKNLNLELPNQRIEIAVSVKKITTDSVLPSKVSSRFEDAVLNKALSSKITITKHEFLSLKSANTSEMSERKSVIVEPEIYDKNAKSSSCVTKINEENKTQGEDPVEKNESFPNLEKDMSVTQQNVNVQLSKLKCLLLCKALSRESSVIKHVPHSLTKETTSEITKSKNNIVEPVVNGKDNGSSNCETKINEETKTQGGGSFGEGNSFSNLERVTSVIQQNPNVQLPKPEESLLYKALLSRSIIEYNLALSKNGNTSGKIKCKCDSVNPVTYKKNGETSRTEGGSPNEEAVSSFNLDRGSSSMQQNMNSQLSNPYESHFRMYRCNFCTFITNNVAHLFLHKKEKHHNSRYTFRCSYCLFVTSESSILKYHIRMAHDNNAEMLKCSDCAFETRCRGALGIHRKEQHAPIFICATCTYVTKRKQYLIKHIRTAHKKMSKVKMHAQNKM